MNTRILVAMAAAIAAGVGSPVIARWFIAIRPRQGLEETGPIIALLSHSSGRAQPCGQTVAMPSAP